MKRVLDLERKAIFLQKPSGTIVIGGDLTERERKLYNGLLKAACSTLKVDPREHWFRIQLRDLKKVLRLDEQDKNNSALKEVLKRMSRIMIEYNLLKKDKHIHGFAHLLDNVTFETDLQSRSTVIRFSIPEMVRLAILNQENSGYYAKIDLVIIRGLRSKYSILLYEMVCDYREVEIPQMTMSEFRKAFGIEDKYPKIPDLKRRVLDPACNELNCNPYVNFLISYKLVKKGNKYTHIKFSHRPKSKNMVNVEGEVVDNLEEVNCPKTELDILLSMIPEKERARKSVKRILSESLEKYGYEYCERNVRYSVQKATKNFPRFLSQSIENDWALSSGWWEDEKQRLEKEALFERVKNACVEMDGRLFRTDSDGFVSIDGKLSLPPSRLVDLIERGKARLIDAGNEINSASTFWENKSI